MMNCYTNLFISEVYANSNGANESSDAIKTVMKSSVLGLITSIKKFTQKTIYTVDDGTGSLDCVIWHDESASTKRITKLRMELCSEETFLFNHDSIHTCHLLLNKIAANEEEAEYSHGDKICCLGLVKLVKGRLLLDINQHYKVNNVNDETIWNLRVLTCHRKEAI